MPADQQELTLRPERPEDEPLLFELYASTRQEELDAMNWPAAMRSAFVTMQFKAQRTGYASMFPRGEFQMIMLNGRTIGRMVVDRVGEEIRLVDLVIAPEHRSAGIGTQLISALIRQAETAKKPVRLSVLTGNRAIRLYERLGFRKTGQEGFHDDMEWVAPPNKQ